MMKNKLIGLNLVLATALISGFSIFINQYGVKKIDPYFYTFAKNAVAAIFLCAILFLGKHRRELTRLERQDKIRLALVGLIGGALAFLLYFKGLSMTSAIKAGFIHKTLFLFVGILSVIFLKEKIDKSLVFGLAVLAAGSVLFLGIKPQAVNFGDLLVLGAVILWAVEIIIAKQALAKLPGTLVASARLAIGSLFILLFLAITGRAALVSAIDGKLIFWSLATGLLLFAYNWTFYNGLKRITAAEATAVLTLGMPITGVLTLVFNEKSWGSPELAGAVLIVAGALLASGAIKMVAKRLAGPKELYERT